jgi:hypothetical protein
MQGLGGLYLAGAFNKPVPRSSLADTRTGSGILAVRCLPGLLTHRALLLIPWRSNQPSADG